MPPVENFANDARIKNFWTEQREKVDSMTNGEYRQLTKSQILPLARIKKIMKIEDDVKNQMISGEGPILIAKASEFLIEELTLRAWLHAESHRRKTLQKIDIGNATLQNEMFDFLIDIVPRPGHHDSNGPIPIRPRPSPNSSTSNQNSEHPSSIDNASTSTFAIEQNGQPIQYYVQQCPPELLQSGDGEEDGSGEYNAAPHVIYYDPSTMNGSGGSVFTLEDGRTVEAMEIGQPIPLMNQPIQVVTMPNGAQIVQSNQDDE